MASSENYNNCPFFSLPKITLPPIDSFNLPVDFESNITTSTQSKRYNSQRYCLRPTCNHKDHKVLGQYDRLPIILPPISDLLRYSPPPAILNHRPLTPPFIGNLLPPSDGNTTSPCSLPQPTSSDVMEKLTTPKSSPNSTSSTQQQYLLSPPSVDFLPEPSFTTTQAAQSVAVPVYTRDSTEAGYMCRHCLGISDTPKSKRVFRTLNSLRLHVKLHHERGRTFYCEVVGCQKGFFRKQDLERHAATHLPEGCKPFMCKCCGTRFTRNDALRRHIKALRCVKT